MVNAVEEISSTVNSVGRASGQLKRERQEHM